MALSTAFGPGISVVPCLSLCSLPHYAVEQCFAQEGTQHDVQRFVALPNYPGRLSISRNHLARDIATVTGRKWWKHCEGRGASNFRTTSAEVNIPFVCCVEEVRDHRRLVSLLAIPRRENAVATDLDVVSSFLDENWSRLELVFNRRYWAVEHHFQTVPCVCNSIPDGWHNFEIFSVVQAERRVLYLIVLSLWDEYECPYILFVSTPFVLW